MVTGMSATSGVCPPVEDSRAGLPHIHKETDVARPRFPAIARPEPPGRPGDGPAVGRPCRAAAPHAAIRRRGGGTPHLRPSLCRLRAHGAGVRDRGHPHAPHREADRLVPDRARLAGAQCRLSRGRAGSLHRCGEPRARQRRLRGARRRHHRHRVLDRHRHAQPRGTGRPGAWAFAPMSSACRCSAWAAPAASPASPSPAAWRAPGRVRRFSWSRSRSAPRPSAWTSCPPPTWWRPPCSATARRPVSCGRGESGLARIEGAGEHLWPDSLDIMGWKVDPSGPRRHLRPLHSAVRRGACRIGGRRHPGAHRRGARVRSIASPAIPAAPR